MATATVAKVQHPTSSQTTLSPLQLYSRYGLAGGLCASLTHTVLVPMDVVKTRLQINEKYGYKGMVDAFIKIPKQEGVSALFLGLTPTTIGYVMQGALKFGLFEFLRDRIVERVGPKAAQQHKMKIYLLASALGETAATIALCPWEAIRIRAVAQGKQAGGMLSTFNTILKKEGFMNGLYRGIGPILFKQVPYTMTQITVFSLLVESFYGQLLPRTFGRTKNQLSTHEQLAVSVACGSIAGVVSAIASHPPDTLLSRINAVENVNKESAITRMRQIVRELGFRGIWAGIGTRMIFIGTLSAAMFLIYDSVKVMVGLPTTSGISDKQPTVDDSASASEDV